MTYEDFIQSKRHSAQDQGIEPRWMPDNLFDYQRHVCEYAIRKGRKAIGVELKESYYKQAVLNLQAAGNRFVKHNLQTSFEL